MYMGKETMMPRSNRMVVRVVCRCSVIHMYCGTALSVPYHTMATWRVASVRHGTRAGEKQEDRYPRFARQFLPRPRKRKIRFSFVGCRQLFVLKTYRPKQMKIIKKGEGKD